MNPETKVRDSWYKLYTDYVNLVGYEAIAFYYHLLWLENQSLGRPLTFSYIRSKIKKNEDEIKALLGKLLSFNLINKKRVENNDEKDWEFLAKAAGYLSKEQKIEGVEKMFKKVLIKESEKAELIEYINDTFKDDLEVTKEHAEFVTKDKDFNEEPRQIGEDTYLGLVHYYYKALSGAFGGKWVSRRDGVEAANLKTCMQKNGDSPDQVRMFFDWIIERARRKDKFNEVSSLGLYPEFRKHAYYALVVKKGGDQKFVEQTPDEVSPEEKLIMDMGNLYKLYLSDGMSHLQIIEKLSSNFNENEMSTFLKNGTANAV